MKQLQDLMNEITTWADATFGVERRPSAVIYHLKQETDELIDALLSDDKENIKEEYADCFILIINSAAKYGITAEQLIGYAKDKLEICKTRTWGQADENGVVNHIKS